jgi:hypothetical protein
MAAVGEKQMAVDTRAGSCRRPPVTGAMEPSDELAAEPVLAAAHLAGKDLPAETIGIDRKKPKS